MELAPASHGLSGLVSPVLLSITVFFNCVAIYVIFVAYRHIVKIFASL